MKFFIALLLASLSNLSIAKSIELDCDYQTYSDQGGNHKVTKPFILGFVIDDITNKAYEVGSIGVSEVSFIKGIDSYSFVEITDTGNVMSTTIDNSLTSTHSRNTVISGEVIPSQYYGKCKIKKRT
ncbi:TPA: hypothetical protein ACSP0C_003299 [Aeromonas veronii]